jgi:hypothetical protein
MDPQSVKLEMITLSNRCICEVLKSRGIDGQTEEEEEENRTKYIGTTTGNGRIQDPWSDVHDYSRETPDKR